MPVSVFFNNYSNSMEQDLIESLIVESIKIYGLDLWYIPRNVDHTRSHFDDFDNDVDGAKFTESYMVDMYIKNIDSFEGQGTFMSKFGLQIRDQVTFTCAMRTFDLEVVQQSAHNHYADDQEPIYSHTITRPREGDLIYLPLNKKLFEITFVEHEAIFYQMGTLQTYDIKCELFEYSGEVFDTGIPEVDQFYAEKRKNLFETTSQEVVEKADAFADNFTLQKAAEKVTDFDEPHRDQTFGW